MEEVKIKIKSEDTFTDRLRVFRNRISRCLLVNFLSLSTSSETLACDVVLKICATDVEEKIKEGEQQQQPPSSPMISITCEIAHILLWNLQRVADKDFNLPTVQLLEQQMNGGDSSQPKVVFDLHDTSIFSSAARVSKIILALTKIALAHPESNLFKPSIGTSIVRLLEGVTKRVSEDLEHLEKEESAANTRLSDLILRSLIYADALIEKSSEKKTLSVSESEEKSSLSKT